MRIPDYQRGYAWTEKQLKEFWNDLLQLDEGKNHYTGVLTLEEVPEASVQKWDEDQWIIRSKNYAPFYVVDGQQRLTTSIILVQAIAERIPADEKINYTTADEIRKKFIYDSKDEGISRSYIFGYEKDNPSYEFLKTKVFMERSDNSFSTQETIYTHNLSFAKEFFRHKLAELDLPLLGDLYRKLTQQFLFNIYSISDDVDVFVAFETMNNRGKPLSHLELLKNRLIYLSTKFEEDENEKNRLRHCINETWKTVYHYLGKNKENPLDDDLFLRHHFTHYFGYEMIKEGSQMAEIDASSMRRLGKFEYKDYLLEVKFTAKTIKTTDGSEEDKLSVKDIYTYVNNLKESVETWYQLFNPSDSSFSVEEKLWLEKINRLGIQSVASVAMAFYLKESSVKSRVRLLKVLERRLFIRMLIGPQIMEVDIPQWAHQLTACQSSPDKIIKDIEQNTEEISTHKYIVEAIAARFKQQSFYDWRGIKYLLFEYELELKSETKTFRDKLNWDVFSNEDMRDYYTVEHVYPQRPRHSCWTAKFKDYSDRERSALRHSLGNLVPLSQPKNSSFQNKCFVDKKGNSETKVGFLYGSYSENEIAANNADWTAREILLRGLKMLGFLERRWKIGIGDTKNKIRILGLDFVCTKEKLNLP
jgi:uncharacterized protein with ParB-like and HNH nuclease domain